MNANALGQPTILQPGQMPMQGQNFQYAGFPHQDGSPVMTPGGGGTGAPLQGVGMVPGVPGSMGLNPGNRDQQMGGGGPIMTPGGGDTGAPLQGPPGLSPRINGMMHDPRGSNLQFQFAGHPGGGLGQLFQSPQFQSLMQNPAMQQFIQGHPMLQRFMPQGGAPIAQPGANPQNALAPPMMPPTAAPAMPVNPGMSASTNPNQYGLPTYGG